MAHARKLVRDAVVTAVTGLATTGARVYTEDPYQFQENQLPGLLVTCSESVTVESLDSPLILLRILEIAVEPITKSIADASNLLDQIAEEVEVALGVVLTVGGKQIYLRLTATDRPEFAGEADRPIARMALRYETSVYTAANAPGTLL